MLDLLWIALGGALGALARYAVGGVVQARLGAIFPYGTLVVNLSGCLLMGFVTALITDQVIVAPALRFLIPVGFIGAYTTFSTYELETFRAIETGAWLIGAAYAAISLFLGFFAIWLGFVIARRVF